MTIAAFLEVLKKFSSRGEIYFPNAEFASGVEERSNKVREALTKQLGIEYHTDHDLPPDAEMDEEAVAAFKELYQYLDEKDPGGGYLNLAGLRPLPLGCP